MYLRRSEITTLYSTAVVTDFVFNLLLALANKYIFLKFQLFVIVCELY